MRYVIRTPNTNVVTVPDTHLWKGKAILELHLIRKIFLIIDEIITTHKKD